MPFNIDELRTTYREVYKTITDGKREGMEEQSSKGDTPKDTPPDDDKRAQIHAMGVQTTALEEQRKDLGGVWFGFHELEAQIDHTSKLFVRYATVLVAVEEVLKRYNAMKKEKENK